MEVRREIVLLEFYAHRKEGLNSYERKNRAILTGNKSGAMIASALVTGDETS